MLRLQPRLPRLIDRQTTIIDIILTFSVSTFTHPRRPDTTSELDKSRCLRPRNPTQSFSLSKACVALPQCSRTPTPHPDAAIPLPQHRASPVNANGASNFAAEPEVPAPKMTRGRRPERQRCDVCHQRPGIYKCSRCEIIRL